MLNVISSVANIISSGAEIIIETKKLKDEQKDYMPMIKLVGNIEVQSKAAQELRNEVTFDFDDVLIDSDEDEMEFDLEELLEGLDVDKYIDNEKVCVTIEIKNCGNGTINGINIKQFIILASDSVSIYSDEEKDYLCFVDKSCKRGITLLPQESKKVNFIITKRVKENEMYESYNDKEKQIKEFFEIYDDVMVAMDLKIDSLNNTSYNQKGLWGTYHNGEISNSTTSSIKANGIFEK